VVDQLSRTLDGAGALRTVAPSVVLRGWQGRSDRASATALARRTGAGLATTGSLHRLGPDSVGLRMALLDIVRASVLGEIEVVGASGQLGVLVDSLGIELLRTLSRDRPVTSALRVMIGAVPLPALKAFLRGEQFYRRVSYDSALVAYSEAIASDSNFAMAYYRMARVLDWGPPTAGAYASANEYRAQAIVRNHGLRPRDSLLIAADSAGLMADVSTPGNYRLALARFDSAARRYPGDPEVWYAKGEFHAHVPVEFGGDAATALDAFDRAIALDSGYTPAYEHLFDLAIGTGQKDRITRYARAAMALPATDENSFLARLAGQIFLMPASDATDGIASLLDSAGALVLFRAGLEVFLTWPDSNETAVFILRQLADRPVAKGESTKPWVYDSLMRIQYIARALAFRGHLRAAYATDRRLIHEPTASRWTWFEDPFLDLALLDVVPESLVTRMMFPSIAEADVLGGRLPSRYRHGLPWLMSQRDTVELRRAGQRMARAAESTTSPLTRSVLIYQRAASAAYLALAAGDTVDALQRFAALPAVDCVFAQTCDYERLQAVRLLAARGDDRRAARQFDDLIWGGWGSPMAVFARLERARIAERLNDRETALRQYQYVVDVWRTADPELQPYVTEARDALARLGAEPR
jgi:serine/threonine-protein kinase